MSVERKVFEVEAREEISKFGTLFRDSYRNFGARQHPDVFDSAYWLIQTLVTRKDFYFGYSTDFDQKLRYQVNGKNVVFSLSRDRFLLWANVPDVRGEVNGNKRSLHLRANNVGGSQYDTAVLGEFHDITIEDSGIITANGLHGSEVLLAEDEKIVELLGNIEDKARKGPYSL